MAREERFEEVNAIKIMIFLNEYKYKNLEVKDKPDLQCKKNNIGIEVTYAISPEEFVIEKQNKKYDEIDKLNNKILKRNYFLKNDIITQKSTFYNDYELLISQFNKKLNKLNNNYIIFNENNLFIYSKISKIENHYLERLIKEYNNIQKHKQHKFNSVIIFNNYEIYLLNLSNKKANIKIYKK